MSTRSRHGDRRPIRGFVRETGTGLGARVRPGVRAAALVLALVGTVVPLPEANADAGSRSEAIAQALARSGGDGRVLGVREERDENGVVYAVKVLTDGRVRVHRIRGR